jgi:hypothetical protein
MILWLIDRERRIQKSMRLLLVLTAAALLGWGVITGLRTGQVHVRGGVFKRTRNPILYWTSVAAGTLVALVSIAVGFGLIPIHPA